ncbi:hypothetical protein [Halohasta litorea]|uniref:Uncharacterized protein n=1 Tax=Halohasta litorea TaxID=869891 RepID=A0ABD6D7W9_9EURY|nr:hypothetical protein [Halohasta litorea]
MTPTDEPRGLRVEAELTVGLQESSLRLHSEGDTLYVEAPDFDALRELRAAATGEVGGWLRERSRDSPLTIETPVLVRVRGVPVAHYEPTRSAGWLADRLGFGPFRVDLAGVLQAAGRGRWH